MKQLFIIILISTLYFFVTDDVKSETPNITLKCYLNLDFSANNTRNTDSDKILRFGVDKYFNSISLIRLSNEVNVKSEIVRFQTQNSNKKFTIRDTYPREIKVIKSDDMGKLMLKELYKGSETVSHLIDQATLSLQLTTEDSTYYTVCKILDYNTESMDRHISDIIDNYTSIFSG